MAPCAPAEIVAIIGKTEGNGGVNDFTRGYFTQTLDALLSRHLEQAGRSAGPRKSPACCRAAPKAC